MPNKTNPWHGIKVGGKPLTATDWSRIIENMLAGPPRQEDAGEDNDTGDALPADTVAVRVKCRNKLSER